ncbi:MAG: hypothetical protein PHS14_00250 [Elusimicrobia bacterium]|nr:hypothetical protein [Elusimicrobiota bacterium]
MSPIARQSTPPTAPVEAAKVVAQCIAQGMNLPAGRVMLDYERWQVPKDGLFVVVSYLGPAEQVAARSYLDPATNSEVQELLNHHEIQVDLMSIIPDNSARLRRWEVPMSLQSFYARNYSARYGVGLPPLQGPMTDTSKLEPGGMLNRYTLRTAVFSLEKRTLPTSLFDSFTTTLTTGQKGSSKTRTRNIPLEAP